MRLSSKVSWALPLTFTAQWAAVFQAVRGLHSHNVCTWLVVAGVLETVNEDDRDAIKKAKVLYTSCMNESKTLYEMSKRCCFSS